MFFVFLCNERKNLFQHKFEHNKKAIIAYKEFLSCPNDKRIDEIKTIMKNYCDTIFAFKAVVLFFIYVGRSYKDFKYFDDIRFLFYDCERFFSNSEEFEIIIMNFARFLINLEVNFANLNFVSISFSIMEKIKKKYPNSKEGKEIIEKLSKKRATMFIESALTIYSKEPLVALRRLFEFLDDEFLPDQQKEFLLKIILRFIPEDKFPKFRTYITQKYKIKESNNKSKTQNKNKK